MIRHRHRTGATPSLVINEIAAEELTLGDIKGYVEQWLDRARDYTWYFHPAVPLALLRSLENGTGPLDDSLTGWQQWLKHERDTFRTENDCDDTPWDADFAHWLTAGGFWERDTAVVATEQGGWRPGFGVHDGNHRVATAHEQGMTTLPAYLGVRRD